MKWILTIAISVIALSAEAQETVLDVSKDKQVSFESTLGSLSMVIFVDEDCPYDKKYISRIRDLQRAYTNVNLILISSNSDVNQAKKYLMGNQFSGEGLHDPKGLIRKRLGARKSTEAFLLKKEGQSFSILYQGAIDSNPINDGSVRVTYLSNAILNVLNGDPVQKEKTIVAGCALK